MSRFEDLINYCYKQYQPPEKCKSCVNSGNCLHTIENCYSCIKKIHSVKNSLWQYNCSNMVLCYVIKHYFRFVSEIEVAYENLLGGISNNLNIASIGCGAASELYALVEYIQNSKNDLKYHYVGFDKSNIWDDINSFTKSKIKNAEFVKEDFFKYYENSSLNSPNLIIMNYMLSDMVKFSHDEIKDFLDRLAAYFDSTECNNTTILINDIPYFGSKNFNNLVFGKDCMEYLQTKINTNHSTTRKSFGNFTHTGRPYGSLHISNTLKVRMFIKDPYDIQPFNFCNSIQMVIKKTNDTKR